MTKKVSIILIGCVIVLLTGCGKMGTIELQGVTYNKSEFSDNALSWIAMYNSLSEEEKAALSYIPAELQDKIVIEDIAVVEVTSQLLGKVYKIDDNIITIGNGNLYKCEVSEEALDKIQLGDTVEVEYNKYRDEELKIEALSVTVIQKGIDSVGSYVEMLNNIWKISEDMNETVETVLLDLSNTVNLTDLEKEIIAELFQQNIGLKMTNMFVKGSTLNENAMSDWFNTGLILRIDNVTKTETGFNFTINKIREGFDSVIIENCKIDKVDNQTVLSYEFDESNNEESFENNSESVDSEVIEGSEEISQTESIEVKSIENLETLEVLEIVEEN